MKTTFLKTITFAILTLVISGCTSTTNKPSSIFISEEFIKTNAPTPPITNTINNTTWVLERLNNKNVYDYESIYDPYIIFSYDSLFVLGNSGCNEFIGESNIQNNTIDIYNIRNKEQYYPANALERELIYTLNISDNYIIKNDTLVLFHRNTPIGSFIAK